MKSKLSTLVFVLILSAMIVSGCGTTTAEPTKVPMDTPTKVPTAIPTQVPTDTPTKADVEVSEWVLDARDAALAYVSEQYSEEAPAPGLTWTGGSTLPENPPPGWSEYQFTPEDGTGD